jgi:hypothetical protein
MRLPLRAWRETLNSLGFSAETRSPKTQRCRSGKRSQPQFSLEALEQRAMLTTNWLVTIIEGANADPVSVRFRMPDEIIWDALTVRKSTVTDFSCDRLRPGGLWNERDSSWCSGRAIVCHRSSSRI